MFAHGEIRKLCQLQRSMYEALGIKKREFTPKPVNEAMLKEIAEKYSNDLREALNVQNKGKIESYTAIDELKKRVVESYPEDQPGLRDEAGELFDNLKEGIFRDDILNNRRRPDGRRFSEIRPISIEAGWLPRTHGSALFTRGETQALVTVTLGTSQDVQYIDSLETGEIKRRFMLNYNFPPFSVGETGRRAPPEGARSATALGAARARRGDARRRGLSLHRPHRLRHHGIERLVLDGHGLRRRARADGRRRADQGAGRGRGDGSGDGRQEIRHPDRHRRRRGPLRRHGFQSRRDAPESRRSRWTSRSPG